MKKEQEKQAQEGAAQIAAACWARDEDELAPKGRGHMGRRLQDQHEAVQLAGGGGGTTCAVDAGSGIRLARPSREASAGGGGGG